MHFQTILNNHTIKEQPLSASGLMSRSLSQADKLPYIKQQLNYERLARR